MGKDGGPAFPRQGVARGDGVVSEHSSSSSGMSLRDYFAAHAPEMPEEFEKSDPFISGRGHLQVFSPAEKRAYWAALYADALLKEKYRYDYPGLAELAWPIR